MNWLIDRRDKSVGSSASRVVEDMHKDLEYHKSRCGELENIVVQLQEIATKSLEDELFRLEMRRKEILLELEETDNAILDRRNKLEDSRRTIERAIRSESIDASDFTVKAGKGVAATGTRVRIGGSFDSNEGKSAQELRGQKLEEEFLEETEMLGVVKETLAEQVMFVVHGNSVDDVIVYYPAASASADLVSVAMLTEHDEAGAILTPLGNLDSMMSYGPQIVPNHERDFPHVRELSAPLCMRNLENGSGASSAAVPSSKRASTGRVTEGEDKDDKGQLIGAVRLPLTPDVIIDLWRLPDGRCWATTSVDGASFVVLERIYVTSEMSYSVSVVVSVDIYGRHAAKNYMLAEKITS